MIPRLSLEKVEVSGRTGFVKMIKRTVGQLRLSDLEIHHWRYRRGGCAHESGEEVRAVDISMGVTGI